MYFTASTVKVDIYIEVVGRGVDAPQKERSSQNAAC